MSDYFELSADTVMTRKTHGCEWCGELIAKGSKALRRVYKWDGDLRSAHMHPECEAAWNKADYYDTENGWCPGDWKRGSTEPA